MRCARCQHDNPEGAKFCLECGARLPQPCPACGAVAPGSAKFCPECGRSLRPAGGTSDPSSGAPEAYTPRHLAEKILTSRSALEGERKPVTVLFCDLVGSTTLAERLGADAMHVLLNRFFEVALGEVHRYEGTVNQFLGDGFMALFGAPIAHEDHAQRAVLAALGIRSAVAQHPVQLDSGEPLSLVLRMGLHTGFVVVGAIGDNLRMDYTAIGDTTHLASRLQQQAPPGAIVISDTTARLVEGSVSLEPVGSIAIRGKREPVTAHRVLGAGPRRTALEVAAQRALSRFVGRARELGELVDLMARVEEGRGQVVGIVGEPGTGKSRLLLEFSRALTGRATRHLEGRCLSYGSAIPYLPVLDVVRADCGIFDTDTPDVIATKVRRTLGARGMDVADGAPCLLYLLGVKDPDDALGPAGDLAALGADLVMVRTFETLRQLSLRAARSEPLILVVEDLHWIDQTSAAYLDSLVESMAGAAILLLVTYRPGYRPGWIDRSYATQLSLRPLTAQDSLRIVQAIVPDGDFDETLAHQILDKGEGNPFFLEELARVVVDHGGPHAGLIVPDTVHGVLTARIDRLAETPKRVLQTASVLGRQFSERLLQAIWESPEPVRGHLGELCRLEFLYRQSGSDEPAYVFKHALTQDVARSILVAAQRRELHRRAAQALEALYPERVVELAPVLAHHCHEAELWPQAVTHARAAAEAARRAFANREALTLYGQALAAADRAGGPAAIRLALLEARGDVHGILGDFDSARADLEAALAQASEDAVTRGRVLGALGALWGGHKDYQKGLALTRESIEVLRAAGDRRALAEARARLGVMHINLAQMSASRQELAEALVLFRALGDDRGQAHTLEMLAMCAWLSGQTAAARAHAEEARPRLHDLGERSAETSALVILAAVHCYQEGWAAGEPLFADALRLARSMGARKTEAYVQAVAAEAAIAFGAYGFAQAAAGAALALARELGHLEWTTLALAGIGRVLRGCGDPAGARTRHEEMLRGARELGAAIWISDALTNLGEDLLALGDPAAEAVLVEALGRAGDAVRYVVRPLLALAELALERGRPREALEMLERSRKAAGEMPQELCHGRCLESEALLALGRRAEALHGLRQTRAEAIRFEVAPVQWRAGLALARLLAGEGRTDEARVEAAATLAVLERVAGDLGDSDLRRRFEQSAPMREARTRAG